MTLKHKNTFLGTGWNFPVKFNSHIKGINLVSNAECIAQNIKMLLSTRQGERPMFPNYGHQLYTMIYEQLDQTLIYRVKEHLEYIFMIYEPRITLEEIHIETHEDEDHTILINLYYLIRETNTRTNLVFPYYLIEK